MSAAITVTPAQPMEGNPVIIDGTGFLPSTKVTVTIPQEGIEVDVNSNEAGEVNSSDLADLAVATLTLSGNAVAAETVTIGAVTYTWRAAPTTVANEVKVGADASTSLDNLKAAVNADPAGSGTLYGSLTVVHPTVGAGAKTATTLKLFAKTGGTGGNSLASTETMTNGAFGGSTFAGGAAAGATPNPLVYTPQDEEPFTVTMTDGTNSASITVRVWESM